MIRASRSSQHDPSQQQTCPGDPPEHHTSHQSHCCSHIENHASLPFPYSPNLLHSAICSFINKKLWSLNTITVMYFVVAKHVTAAENKCGNTRYKNRLVGTQQAVVFRLNTSLFLILTSTMGCPLLKYKVHFIVSQHGYCHGSFVA